MVEVAWEASPTKPYDHSMADVSEFLPSIYLAS